jgi:hypothetical protein
MEFFLYIVNKLSASNKRGLLLVQKGAILPGFSRN